MKKETFEIRFNDGLQTITPKKIIVHGDFTFALHRPYVRATASNGSNQHEPVQNGWIVTEKITGMAIGSSRTTMKQALAKLDELLKDPNRIRKAQDRFLESQRLTEELENDGKINTWDIINDLTKTVKSKDFNHILMIMDMINNSDQNINDQLGAIDSIKESYPDIYRYMSMFVYGHLRIKSNYQFI